MIDTLASPAVDATAVEALLRDDLAQGDAMLGSVGAILRHLLTSDDSALFSEEVIARLRGMLADIARQLLDQFMGESGADHGAGPSDERQAELAALLAGQPALLAHVHAVALEAQLTDRLQARLSLDPVLSPLLQALISSPQSAVAADAMALLAAQARFIQAMRRMQLPLTELPADLLHAALLTLRHVAGEHPEAAAAAQKAEAMIRSQYDESRTRLGQLARIVTGMGAGASAALSLAHAGVGLFLTALGLASGQDREMATLSTGDGQMARLALSLRAAGLKPETVEEQFLALHPEALMPTGFEVLGADRAAAMLARSSVWPGA